jgi:K+-transporting ATPase KdpF subunit
LSLSGLSQKPATACKDPPMDFLIAGIAAVLLFGYLIYALLRPEKF